MPSARRPPPPRSSRPRTSARPRPQAPTAKPATSGTVDAAAVRTRSRFTGRMAVLVVVLAVLVVSYASSMRAYLQQRHHILSLRAEITSSQSDISRLQGEKKRWRDPAYVTAQAKLRFGWVMPGDTAFQVIGKDGKPLVDSDRLTDPSQVVRTTPTAWWAKEYDSLQQADHPPKAAPTPVTSIRPPATTK